MGKGTSAFDVVCQVWSEFFWYGDCMEAKSKIKATNLLMTTDSALLGVDITSQHGRYLCHGPIEHIVVLANAPVMSGYLSGLGYGAH
jgi:hypothetical protein